MAQDEVKKEQPSVYKATYDGIRVALLDALANQALTTIKIRNQCNKSFTFNPFKLYKGFILNAGITVPITTFQIAFNQFLKNHFLKEEDAPFAKQFAAAFVSGVDSAFLCCPAEMTVTYQVKMGKKPLESAQDILAQGGRRAFGKGLLSTMGREGGFAAFLLAVTPKFKEKAVKEKLSDESASLVAGISAGGLAAVSTQVLDTIRAKQQGADLKDFSSATQVLSKIYSEQPTVLGFFKEAMKGGTARLARVAGGITVMSYAYAKLQK